MEKKKLSMNKKGKMSSIFANITAILISLILVVVLGAIVVLITTNLSDSLSVVTSATITNESVVFSGGGAQVAIRPRVNTGSVTLTNVSNGTIGSNNFDSFANGSIILKEGATAIYSQGASPTLNGSYSTNKDSDTQQVLKNSTKGTGNIFNQFGTVGTVIGVMLILGAVLFFLGRRKGEGIGSI